MKIWYIKREDDVHIDEIGVKHEGQVKIFTPKDFGILTTDKEAREYINSLS